MRRKTLGRDFGLLVRMLVVATILVVLYAALLFVAFKFAWSERSDLRAWLVPLVVILGIYGHYRGADRMALAAIRASEVGSEDEPELFALVEKLSTLANVPAPRLAVSPLDAPNAFAAGTSPQRATIAVTEGLRSRLAPQELEAVLGHELSHIVHRDAFVVTAASLFPTVGAYLGRWRFGASDFRERKRDAREWVFWPIIMILAVVLFVFGKLLTFTISRYREYAADRGSVLLTGAPEQLMSALQKVTGEMAQIPKRDLRTLAGLNAMFIIPAAVSRWSSAAAEAACAARGDGA